MKTALIKNLGAWMLGLSVFIGATTGPVQPAAAETLLVGDTIQIVVTAPFYTELSWNNYAGYLGYQPIGARGKVLVGPTVDAWTTWVRVDLTLPTTHVIGWVQVSQVTKVTTTSVAPTITSPPSNATVTAPAAANFSVSASGTAPLSYQWQKNGVNIVGATSAIYTTPATSTLDSSSTFRVVVANSAGSITSSAATLMVNAGAVAPSVMTPPSNATVTAPALASFSVSASGTAPLSYQWQKNGVNLSGATSTSYLTPATTTADSGSTYRVVVSNGVGSVTSSAATLTVIPGAVAPSITSQPSNATVTAPASATFSVSASGTSLSYQWKKNGTVVGTGTTYTTPATSTVDSGSTFVVVVSNTAGSVISSVATLTVLPGVVAPATVSLTYSGKLRDKVGQGDNALGADGALDGTFTLTLGAGSGNRTVTALDLRNSIGGEWDTLPGGVGYWALGTAASLDAALLNGVGTRVSVPLAAGGSLTLFASDYNLTEFVSGMGFTVTATFADGSTASATTTVNAAAVAPTITTQPANTTVTAPASATFSVSASGTSLSYQWKKNGAVVGTGATYTTPATSTADSGSTFSVVVTNSAGSVTSANATLAVNAAPVAPAITAQPVSATVTAPASATFSVSASGTAPLTYQWQRNTVNITGATAASYTTPATTTLDSGSTFRVVVTNSAGSITSSAATLTVTPGAVAPSITSQPTSATVTAPASATFSASASGTALLSYQWQKNTVNISGATSSSYTTPATSTPDSGSTFRVVVTNSAGSITSSAATLTVNVAGDTTPPSVPTGLSASAGSCSQITISWGASTDAGGSGLKGYNLYRNSAFLKQVLSPLTSTTDTALTPSTAYSYQVSAVDNANNESGQSGVAITNTLNCDATPPSQPTNLRVWAASCNRLGVMWSASTDNSGGSGLKGYNVSRDGVFLKQVTASPLYDTVPDGSATYSYTVSALDNAGNESAPSAPMQGSALSLISFPTTRTYPTGTGPNSVAIGDLNGDGVPDLAVANSGSNTVGILLGRGDGTFQAQVAYPTGTGPNSVAIGDLDGDGILDLVTASKNGLSVFLGRGDGTFIASAMYPAGSAPVSVVIGDLNRDGHLDLAVANYAANTVSILLGHGNGTFGPHITFATGKSPLSLALGDLDSDGNPDLVTANRGSNDVSILFGRGDGTFHPHVTYPTGTAPQSVAIGDLNGDGLLDLAVVNFGSGTVSVLLGTGGTFHPLPGQNVYSFPGSVAIGHFNRDDALDLAVTSQRTNVITMLTGDGTGLFQNTGAPYSTGLIPVFIATADLNGDGAPDLVVANYTSGTLSVLLNACH